MGQTGQRRVLLNLRVQQKAERRTRILNAAREIIATKGYEALTMRELASAAGVTVPTIYNLIGSKDELLLAAIQEQTANFIDAIESSARQTPASRIISVVEHCVDELLRLPDYYRSLLRLLLTAEANDGLRSSVSDSLAQQFERALLDMAKVGQLSEWTKARPLAERLGSHLRITTIEWAGGDFDPDRLRSTALYGSCLMLLGVAEGPSAEEILACALRCQPGARPLSTDGDIASPHESVMEANRTLDG
jgi:AcrR family transcriptional regulator